jgi:hypothetical protein
MRSRAEVAESVDAADSKSAALKSVWVRVPPSAPNSQPLMINNQGFSVFVPGRPRRGNRDWDAIVQATAITTRTGAALTACTNG